ncbi:MAG: type II secretion system F family protein [Halobacteriales archaeon]|nr:type II secretion system F family protein [Halobacteriales archaeon]
MASNTDDAAFEVDDPDDERRAELLNRVADAVVAVRERFATDADRSRLDRFAYRRFAGTFRDRRDRFESYRRVVNQARYEESYDRYLARATLWTLVALAGGTVVGLLFALLLRQLGVFAGLSLAVSLGPLSPVAALLKIPLGMGFVTLAVGLFVAAPVGASLYYAPRFAAYQRERAIGYLLPQAVTYMFALSQGDLPFPAIVRRLAQTEDTYGEVAVAFQAVTNDMDFFGSDLRSALRSARESTPSTELAELLDDMIGIIDTGGDVTPFLRSKAEEYQERRRRANDQTVDTVGMYAQLYMIVGVAFPLFLLITLTIMVAISGSGMARLQLVVYLLVPTVAVGFIVLIDAISPDDLGTSPTLPVDDDRVSVPELADRLDGETTDRAPSRTSGHTDALSPTEASGIEGLRAALRRQSTVRTFRAPIDLVRRRPIVSLAISVPVALVYIGVIAIGGIAVPTPTGFFAAPVATTLLSVVVPLFGILTPLAYFHERNYRHRQRVNRELPDVVRKLASTSETGMTLAQNIGLVGETSEGYLAGEFRRVDRAMEYNVVLGDALRRMSNRVRNERLTRIVHLLAEANAASGRVRAVLTVVADDVRTAYRLETRRKDETRNQLVIGVMGFLLYLVVAVGVIEFYLPPMAEAASQANALGASTFGTNIDIDAFRVVLFHGTLVQALATGLVSGQIAYDSALSGLKLALPQLLLATVVFCFI